MCPTSGNTTVLIIQSVMLADQLINCEIIYLTNIYYKIITYVEIKSLTSRKHIPGTAGKRYLHTVELKSLTTPSWSGTTDQHMSGRIHPTLHIAHRLWRRLRQLITSSPYPVDMDRAATPTILHIGHRWWPTQHTYMGVHKWRRCFSL